MGIAKGKKIIPIFILFLFLIAAGCTSSSHPTETQLPSPSPTYDLLPNEQLITVRSQGDLTYDDTIIITIVAGEYFPAETEEERKALNIYVNFRQGTGVRLSTTIHVGESIGFANYRIRILDVYDDRYMSRWVVLGITTLYPVTYPTSVPSRGLDLIGSEPSVDFISRTGYEPILDGIFEQKPAHTVCFGILQETLWRIGDTPDTLGDHIDSTLSLTIANDLIPDENIEGVQADISFPIVDDNGRVIGRYGGEMYYCADIGIIESGAHIATVKFENTASEEFTYWFCFRID